MDKKQPPTHQAANKVSKRIRHLKIFLGISILIILCLVGYILYDSNKSKFQIHEMSFESVRDSINNSLIEKYNVQLNELDTRLGLMPKSLTQLQTAFASEPRTYKIGLTSKIGIPVSYISGDLELTRNDSAFLSIVVRKY